MVALIIVATIIVLITILLLSHVKLIVRSDGDIDLRVKFGFLSFKLNSPKKKKKIKLSDFTQKKYLQKLRLLEEEKKKEKTADATKKDKKEKKQKKQKDKNALSDTVEFILEIIEKAETYTGRLVTEVRHLTLIVGGKDPAAIAVTYGVLAQTAAYLLEILDLRTKLKKPAENAVNITCDYLSEKTVFDVDISVKIRIIDALITAVDILMIKLRHDSKNINTYKNKESEERSNG